MHEDEIKRRRASVLFWVIMIVFLATAVLALLALAIAIGLVTWLEPPDPKFFNKLVICLWGGLFIEVVGLFVTVSRDYLGLQARPELDKTRRKSEEVIEHLASRGKLSEDLAEEVLAYLGLSIARGGPVLRAPR